MSEISAPAGFEVVLTEKAARIIRDAFAAEKADPERTFVRIGAMPGGCSGYKFSLDVARDSDVSDRDARFTSQGIQVVVDRVCLTDVLGSVEVDFKDDNLVEQGFAFRQLEPSATCGCGQSFAPIKSSRS
jgi:iron-sulfur cluster assembly protein